ncbi:hypothetical protein [Sorangium sp. So ce233]|uniref:hypothetical protein n=1 Tax=Sorangium sp. So ce233 TaxID=3133290 RepID=UPI003F60D88E
MLKLDPGGDLLWAKSFGDDKAQSTTSIAMTDGGDIALTGDVSGRVDLGTGTTDSARPLTQPEEDSLLHGFLVKFAP